MSFLRNRKIFVAGLVMIVLLGLAGCKVAPNTPVGDTTPQLPQPKTLSDPTWIALDKAIHAAASGREDVLAYLLYNISIDSVQFSSDGNLALVWTALVDKNTGLVQSGEPGLAIAHKTSDGQWKVTLQADSTFAAELQAVPDSLLSAENKSQYMPAMQQSSKSGVVYSGYRLPWANGLTKRLSGSIGHVLTYKSCPTTCLYAFDFADGTMFPIAAAKAGIVKYAVWEYPNGNTTNTNYLVIEDDTTTPTTYMVYYHLAQNSIDPALRVAGAKVYQGQFLANADDTGASTGNHLHFMVHTTPNSVWGSSVDIVFDEVTINGGRPRTCTEAASFPEYGSQCMPGDRYTSANGDNAVPTGGLTLPEANSVLTSPTVTVTGWMKDDIQVSSGQLMYKVSGDWLPIGPKLTDTKFTTQINLCDANIPDGKFYLSLVATDSAGKSSDVATAATLVEKQYSCAAPAPACTVTAGQAILYSETNFQGTCQALDIGDYANMDNLYVKSDQTRSVQLGSGVSLLLYTDPNFGGTQELFQNGDSDLSDNIVRNLTVSSVKVVKFIVPPTVPTLTLPKEATTEDGVTLAWTVDDGVETRADLTGPNGYTQSLEWQTGGSWSVGLLAAGDYTLKVEARNLAGNTSIAEDFTISTPITLPVVKFTTLPEQMNSTAIPLAWTVTSGSENIDHFEIQWQLDGGEWTSWETQPAASDRKVTFTGEMGHSYGFRIRGVEANGKAADFSGLTAVSTAIASACQDDQYEGTAPGDDEQGSAASLLVGTPQTHNWCPAADVDWVAFQATKDEELRLTTTAVGNNAAAIEQLYDTDGVTQLGINTPADGNTQASLDWTVPADGIYYIKYSPVDRQISGTDASYKVDVEVQNTVQTTPLVCGSIAIPAVLGGAYALVSKSVKKKKTAKRAGWD
jgi:murein DD-endopeptidase MepM/ murein hydrolase activator NlpD